MPARGHLPGAWCGATCTSPTNPIVSAAAKLRKAGVFSRVDDSSQSIGKRYSRNDELGTPFGITVDFACT